MCLHVKLKWDLRPGTHFSDPTPATLCTQYSEVCTCFRACDQTRPVDPHHVFPSLSLCVYLQQNAPLWRQHRGPCYWYHFEWEGGIAEKDGERNELKSPDIVFGNCMMSEKAVHQQGQRIFEASLVMWVLVKIMSMKYINFIFLKLVIIFFMACLFSCLQTTSPKILCLCDKFWQINQ